MEDLSPNLVEAFDENLVKPLLELRTEIVVLFENLKNGSGSTSDVEVSSGLRKAREEVHKVISSEGLLDFDDLPKVLEGDLSDRAKTIIEKAGIIGEVSAVRSSFLEVVITPFENDDIPPNEEKEWELVYKNCAIIIEKLNEVHKIKQHLRLLGNEVVEDLPKEIEEQHKKWFG
mmetsp:Transcript_12497/g.14358  ORF Transcript_12497/g.14358 Transcript_12497/m.14358 type:complete len:174 (-) Transcript_12497:156-677(-)|eukprot:CAMPEP_0184022026 /NCGR_PEP_ID=MMETSP0954-20121128/10320_1 /TAXON_ID=627963 /ORGANISM="Aplanochytrium sp, Strain PBS07" /LENGTH=173 /DNA_ID=CAMNT_0026304241 /DNA_START=20 /DNA_END=541 /DNA_ORIENTATION=+